MKELFELVEARRRAPHVPYAVATVLRVEGSSYRRPGARMLINAHGRVAGSISGGCLEKRVITDGQLALLDGRPRLLSFDTTDQDDLALGASLGCQGKIWIGLEVLPAHSPWLLENLAKQVGRRRSPVVLVTEILGDPSSVHFNSMMVRAESNDEAPSLVTVGRDDIAEVIHRRKTRFVGDEIFGSALVEWVAPPLSLLLFGDGPDVVPLLRLARELGHQVTVIGRRPDYAIADNFPEAHRVLLAKPHHIATLLTRDDRTAAVLMNHHYETDRDMLAALIPFDLPYIALLGPRRRTESILQELSEDGRDVAALAQPLHGPAGLDLGAETPEQIALAILAEIQSTLAGRTGEELRWKNAPIHADALIREEPSCAVLA